jgi:hypothetical protein
MDSYLSNSSLVHSIPKSNSWIYSTKLQILVIRSNFKIDIEPFQHQLLVLVFLLMTPCLPLTWHSRKCLKILVQNTSYVTHHIIIVPLSTMKISKILYSLITQCDYTTSINTMHLTSLVSTDSQIQKITFPSKYTLNSLLPPGHYKMFSDTYFRYLLKLLTQASITILDPLGCQLTSKSPSSKES